MPEPGDMIIAAYPSGQTHKSVWIICPDCSEGRYVRIWFKKRPGFTGRCRKCNIERARTRGWSRFGFYV